MKPTSFAHVTHPNVQQHQVGDFPAAVRTILAVPAAVVADLPAFLASVPAVPVPVPVLGASPVVVVAPSLRKLSDQATQEKLI